MKIVASIIVIGANNFTFHPPVASSVIAAVSIPEYAAKADCQPKWRRFPLLALPSRICLGASPFGCFGRSEQLNLLALFLFLQSFMRFASSIPGSLNSMLLAFAPACPLLAHMKVVGVVILFRERTSRGYTG